MADTAATWTIELYCECPHCEEYVDLLDDPEFWHGREFDAGEHGSNRTKNVDVHCPECSKEFSVDFEY